MAADFYSILDNFKNFIGIFHTGNNLHMIPILEYIICSRHDICNSICHNTNNINVIS